MKIEEKVVERKKCWIILLICLVIYTGLVVLWENKVSNYEKMCEEREG